jgi:hypothetical protein
LKFVKQLLQPVRHVIGGGILDETNNAISKKTEAKGQGKYEPQHRADVGGFLEYYCQVPVGSIR